MASDSIPSKWVVQVRVEEVDRPVWLGWSSLAELLETATELVTEPNLFLRVALPDETLRTLEQLLEQVRECHVAYERFTPHRCRMPAARLASAANALQEQAALLADSLASRAHAQGLAREQQEARRAFLAAWETCQARCEADLGMRAPFPDCTGDVEVSLTWGW